MRLVRQAILALSLLVIGLGALAQTGEDEVVSAHTLMVGTTDRVMEILAEAAVYHEEEPERFFEQIHGVLDELVDFDGFARGVMGRYASKKRYLAMSEEQKMQFREQVSRFSSVIRIGLVRTYGKGLLAFNGSEVKILPPPEDADPAGPSTTVVQHIFSGDSEPYVIRYSMRRDKTGDWRMRNLIVESINLGQIYRNQFESAMRDYKGDMDQVIDTWDIESAEVDESVDKVAERRQDSN
jgi:phospholipid transport system substrate-binding protein